MNYDLLLIVYRYVHEYRNKYLKAQYYLLYQQYFNDTWQFFYIINDKKTLFGWCCDRHLENTFGAYHENYSFNNICRIRGQLVSKIAVVVGLLPKRYRYSNGDK
jgi:hypothetical protein